MLLRSSIKRASCWIPSVAITWCRPSRSLRWKLMVPWKFLSRSSKLCNITPNQTSAIWIFRKKDPMNKRLLTAGPAITKDRMVLQAPERVKWETQSPRVDLSPIRSFQAVSLSPSAPVLNSLQLASYNSHYSATTLILTLGQTHLLDVKFSDSEVLTWRPIKSTTRRIFIPLWICRGIRLLMYRGKISMFDKIFNLTSISTLDKKKLNQDSTQKIPSRFIK